MELYNTGDEEVDISGWRLLYEDEQYCIEIPPYSISPHSFCVVGASDLWLDNDVEVVVLQNEACVEIDRTPCLGDEENSYCAWSRFPDGEDTDTNFEWGFMNSTMGGRASGNICYPKGGIYFHVSGAVEGDISTIEVTPNGRLATPTQSYYANINYRGNKIFEQTTALEGHYSSDEDIYNGGSAVRYPEPGTAKPDMCEYYLYGKKSIDYTGEGLNDREYLGREYLWTEKSYYSGTEFRYNKEFSKERLGTSLKVHTTGVADLEYRQVDYSGDLTEEYLDRYVGDFDIERHIKVRYLNDSYRGDNDVKCRPGRIISNFVEGEALEACTSDVYNDYWLTCCLDTTLVGSKKSDVYHYCWCAAAKEIEPENLIWFSSPNEAESLGYRPCEECKPSSRYDLWAEPYAECMNSTEYFYCAPL